MSRLIQGFFTNFSVVMLGLALVVASVLSVIQRNHPSQRFAERLLRWTLLLSVGVQGIYTFILHVFFPATSAAVIGWSPSPFQYEVGIANLSVGVLGILAFWGNFGFRMATVVAATCWFWGDAVGHVREMIVAHNFAPGNAGPWFWTDVAVPIVIIGSLLVDTRQASLMRTQVPESDNAVR